MVARGARKTSCLHRDSIWTRSLSGQPATGGLWRGCVGAGGLALSVALRAAADDDRRINRRLIKCLVIGCVTLCHSVVSMLILSTDTDVLAQLYSCGIRQ